MGDTLQEKVLKKVKVKCLVDGGNRSLIAGLVPGEYWKFTTEFIINDTDWAWKQTQHYLDEYAVGATPTTTEADYSEAAASYDMDNTHSGNIGIYVDGILIQPDKIENEVWFNTEIDNDDTKGYDIQILEFSLPASTKGTAISLFIGDPALTSGIVYPVPSRDTGMNGDIRIESVEIIYRRKAIK